MSDSLGETNTHQGGGPSNVKQRRPRLRLNCGECRRRCIRSGRPEQCSFESFPAGAVAISNTTVDPNRLQHNNDQIRQLQAEIAQLKQHLFFSTADPQKQEQDGPTNIPDVPSARQTTDLARSDPSLTPPISVSNIPWDHEAGQARGHYHQSNLHHFFHEIPSLLLFMKDVSTHSASRLGISRLSSIRYIPGDLELDPNQLATLLPPKEDADTLILFYLEHCEHIHRIVHVPIFKREYVNFWAQDSQPYHPAITALMLCMMSIAISGLSTSNAVAARYRARIPRWICACDRWSQQQRPRARTFLYYQLSCLLYIARRMCSVRKRPYWEETGSLIQDAIMDRLHRDPPATDGAYVREMKRRIWSVLRELDLQNSFEFRLPTLLHTLESTTPGPANLDDSDFDEDSETLPAPKVSTHYTRTSYQSLSANSWDLRLEISRRLFSAGGHPSNTLSHEEVLRYTHFLTQTLDSLPPWTVEAGATSEHESFVRKVTLLSWAFLQFQLKECLLAIHRPYLHRNSGMYSFSETVCYQAAKEVLIINRKLAVLATQCLTALREDLLVACLVLCRITLARPKATISIPATNAAATSSLIEDCVPFVEGRYLQSLCGEHWRVLAIYGALASVSAHIGKQNLLESVSCYSTRFLVSYQQHIGRQFEQQHPGVVRASAGGEEMNDLEESGRSHGGGTTTSSSWNFAVGVPNYPFELELDRNM